jgi:uncharacterized membrane protein YfcA
VAGGTSLLAIAINSLTALLLRARPLDRGVIGGFTLSPVAGSLVGDRAVSRVRLARLNLPFTALTVTVALDTAARSFPRLF